MSESEVKFCVCVCVCVCVQICGMCVRVYDKAVIWFAQSHLHISWKCISVVIGICNEETKAVRGLYT